MHLFDLIQSKDTNLVGLSKKKSILFDYLTVLVPFLVLINEKIPI